MCSKSRHRKYLIKTRLKLRNQWTKGEMGLASEKSNKWASVIHTPFLTFFLQVEHVHSTFT